MLKRIFLLSFLVAAPAFAAEPSSADVAKAFSESTIPEGPVGESIRLGKNLVTDTRRYANAYVGNGLNCASCHQEAGTKLGAMSFIGLSGQFPTYNPRGGKVFTLEDRINGCFRRSMNGKPLPLESKEMTAMVAYMTWLSKGIPVGGEIKGRGTPKLDLAGLTPNLDNGKKIYIEKCASCHGTNGEGVYDLQGNPIFPAVWGDKSFNIGAGLARLNTATPFIKANMPFNAPGALSVQEALDVSAYFTTQPRPDYAEKHKDWPNGGKPKDARY